MNYQAMPGLKEFNTEGFTHIQIVNAVQNHFALSFEDIAKKCRKRNIVIARMTLMYFLRKNTHMTLQQIADLFNQDHTTVLHSLQTIRDLRHVYPQIENNIMAINNKLNG